MGDRSDVEGGFDRVGRSGAVPVTNRGWARRRKVLSAAKDQFLKLGYEKTTIDGIIGKCGGSKSSLYRYFPTKADLFRAVVHSIVAGEDGPEIDYSLPMRSALVRYAELRMKVVFSRTHMDLVRLVVSESRGFPDLGQMYYEEGPKRSRRVLAEYLYELRNSGVIDVDDIEESVQLFVGMLIHERHLRNLLLGPTGPGSEEDVRRWAVCAVDTYLKSIDWCGDEDGVS